MFVGSSWLMSVPEIAESWPAGGDVIVKVDGQPVPSVERLVDLIAAKKPGDKIELEVVRGTSRIQLNVKLGRQP